MTPYQLAKVILMAGGINSRKRIQKTLHLLQAAGYDFGLDYRMHYYGPYSAELSELLDCMARDRRLLETKRSTDKGRQYDYVFNQELRLSLEQYEATAGGQAERRVLEEYQPLLMKLRDTPARILELASTVVEFFQDNRDWTDALSKTAEFKGEAVDSPLMSQAIRLAKTVLLNEDG